MKSKQLYVHCGSAHFKDNLFVTPRNCWWKPKPMDGTGLWGSRVGDPYGWRNWCEKNDYPLSHDCFKFKLSENTNLIVLRKPEDLTSMPHISPEDILRSDTSGMDLPSVTNISNLMPQEWCFLDYEKMLSDGVDAIEVIGWPSLCKPLSIWDCNSIYIMNPQIIIEVE